MASTGIRKIDFFDFFHYNTATSCFDNTTTVVWTAPGANGWEAWNTVFGSSEALGSNYMVPGAVAGAAAYLYCQTTHGPHRAFSFDFGMHFNGQALDAGVFFMAATTNLSINSYRIRQTATQVLIERLNGAGSVVWSDAWTYTPDAAWNFYRIHFYPQNMYFESGDVLASSAGMFIVEAGASLHAMAERVPVGTGVDPSPRTTGVYHGIYQGIGSQPMVGYYTIGEDWYPLAKKVGVCQSLMGPAYADCTVLRGDYDQWGIWDPGDYVQIFAFDVDDSSPSNWYSYLDFMGELQFYMDLGEGEGAWDYNSKVNMVFFSPERQLQFDYDTTTHTGNIRDIISEFLEIPGGNHWSGFTKTYGSLGAGLPKNINRLFAQTGGTSVTSRYFKGKKCTEILRHMALVDDLYFYVTPESAFKLTDVWRDKTGVTVDLSYASRCYWWKAYPHDLSKTTNEFYVYRSGGIRTVTGSPDATSHSTYGFRQGYPMSRVIDLQIKDANESGALAQSLHDNHYHDQVIIEAYFLARHMDLRPGDLISLSAPMYQIGGDYSTPRDNWVPETYGILEKKWDTDMNLIYFKFVETHDKTEPPVTVGNQDYQEMVRDMVFRSISYPHRVDESHL